MKDNLIIISGFFLLIGLAGMGAKAKADEDTAQKNLDYINAIKACTQLTDEQAVKACEQKAKEEHQ